MRCGELDQHWFRQWLVAYSPPSHHLTQCSLIINWILGNKLQWNSDQNTKLFIEEKTMSSVKWRPFCRWGVKYYNGICSVCWWPVTFLAPEHLQHSCGDTGGQAWTGHARQCYRRPGFVPPLIARQPCSLLALSEGNPPVTDGFSSQRVSNA